MAVLWGLAVGSTSPGVSPLPPGSSGLAWACSSDGDDRGTGGHVGTHKAS